MNKGTTFFALLAGQINITFLYLGSCEYSQPFSSDGFIFILYVHGLKAWKLTMIFLPCLNLFISQDQETGEAATFLRTKKLVKLQLQTKKIIPLHRLKKKRKVS
jgi:hypothetical protein